MTLRPSIAALAAAFAATLALADTPLPRATSITVDGEPADWRGQGLALPLLTPDSPLPPDPLTSRASARIAWDETGLVFHVEVVDRTPREADIAAGAYNADSVELFIAPDPARWESLQIVISPGTTPEHPAPRAYVFDNRPAALASLPADTRWAVRRTADGYVVDATLPFAALGLKPAEGLVVGARLFVNDLGASGTRTRFGWQPRPPSTDRFERLVLREALTPGAKTPAAPAVWVAADFASACVRLNILAADDGEQTTWSAESRDKPLGKLTPTPIGADLRAASLALPAPPPASLVLRSPDGREITVPGNPEALAAAALKDANQGWRLTRANKTALAFARFVFPEHVFSGAEFPVGNFIDREKVARLLGAAPVIETTWLDSAGRIVREAREAGLYGARTTFALPGSAKPLVLENIFFRLPAGATVPSADDETMARALGFVLAGADATASQASRVAERWWHGVRRAQGWSSPLPYKLRLPADLEKTNAPRPLVVHLHGTGQFSDKDADEVLGRLATLAGPEPIIAYLQSPSSWRGPAVGEAIDELCAKYPVDRDRVYLIGFSMGGIGTWEVGLDQPERFAALVPIGGRSGSPTDAARLARTPIWVFNGEDDPGTTVAEATLMVEALRRAGTAPKFTVLPGRSHGDSQAAAYAHPGLWPWLLAQRRSPTSTPTP